MPVERADPKKNVSCSVAQFAGTIFGMLIYFLLYLYVIATNKGNDALFLFASVLVFIVMLAQLIFGIGRVDTNIKPVSLEEYLADFLKGLGGFTVTILTIALETVTGRNRQV